MIASEIVMSACKLLTAMAAVSFIATPAYALTIDNRDTTEYTVHIKSGASLAEILVAPGGTVENPCEPECLVAIAGLKGEKKAITDDKFIIYDGKLHKEEE
jgi:hypothetical protein